ncbi:MAG: RecX family transcriptional regulator [Nitrospirae bacterium]|nr:RecX family transcriptional regulator [Nitrospirota bacterium]
MTNGDQDEYQRANAAALRLLTLCDRSKKDLRERLLKKDYPAGVVERVIQRSESMGYLDDERFAVKFAMDAVRRKNAGPAVVRYGLQQKGIERRIIEETVGKVFQENEEREVAKRALSRKLEVRSKRSEGRGDEKKRLSDYLRRKGFSYDIIKAAIGEIEDDI